MEASLIEGLRFNDRDAIAAVYDAFAGVAYALAVRTLNSAEEAEDVVQESFIALWKQADRLDAARGLRSYLLSIVHNKAIDRLRRRGRRPTTPLDPDLPVADPGERPEDAAVREAEGEQVRTALAGLPTDQRRAIELTYFGGFTINEVAQQTGVPVGTVKSRLRLALGRLRGVVQQ